jgi:hypothetical protein
MPDLFDRSENGEHLRQKHLAEPLVVVVISTLARMVSSTIRSIGTNSMAMQRRVVKSIRFR